MYDEYNDEEVTLTKEEMQMIQRIRAGQFPHVEVRTHCLHPCQVLLPLQHQQSLNCVCNGCQAGRSAPNRTNRSSRGSSAARPVASQSPADMLRR